MREPGRSVRPPRCFINHDAEVSDPDGFQRAIFATSVAMKGARGVACSIQPSDHTSLLPQEPAFAVSVRGVSSCHDPQGLRTRACLEVSDLSSLHLAHRQTSSEHLCPVNDCCLIFSKSIKRHSFEQEPALFHQRQVLGSKTGSSKFRIFPQSPPYPPGSTW